MASTAKPWLICGYYGLAIVTMLFIIIIYTLVKPWLLFVREGSWLTFKSISR